MREEIVVSCTFRVYFTIFFSPWEKWPDKMCEKNGRFMYILRQFQSFFSPWRDGLKWLCDMGGDAKLTVFRTFPGLIDVSSPTESIPRLPIHVTAGPAATVKTNTVHTNAIMDKSNLPTRPY